MPKRTEKYYKLRSNLITEPLIANWYAWSNLVAPATAAMIMTNQYIPLLESYLKAHKQHEEAVKYQTMRGGPFLDFKGKDSRNQVQALLNQTKQSCDDMVNLTHSIYNLNSLLERECTNAYAMSALYKAIPENLKGYIELTYDLNNRPHFKLIEPLLYRSQYYKSELQSLLCSINDIDDRPFILSTPRFPDNDDVVIHLPFSDSFYDEFFQARFDGLSMSQINQIYDAYLSLQISKVHFLNLFCEIPKNKVNDQSHQIARDNIQIHYFGHACLLIYCNNISILVDPLISYDAADRNSQRFSFKDLPSHIDFVLITHAHQDHLVLESLLQIRHKIGTIIVPRNAKGALQDPSLKLALNYSGFKNVVEFSELDEWEIENGKIIGLPFLGEHADLDIQTKLGYGIVYQNKTIVCVADSDNLDPTLYSHLKKQLPPIHILFLGMECEGAPLSWLYGPLMLKKINKQANQSRRLNGSDSSKALDLVNILGCKRIYIYAMGAEPWVSFISSIHYDQDSKPIVESNKFIQSCNEKGLFAKRLYQKELITL